MGWCLKSSLVCEFKDLGCTRISSIDIGEGCCYWWDVAKHKKEISIVLFVHIFVTNRPVRICLCQERDRGLDQNSGLISVNTAWDLSREHWWDLINFESILFLHSLIVCLSKTVKYLVCLSKWRAELSF